MSLYGTYLAEAYDNINEGFFSNKPKVTMESINEELANKINGNYPWYYIHFSYTGGDNPYVPKITMISLYGFGKKPTLLNGSPDTYIGDDKHKLYSVDIKGDYNKNHIKSEIRKYTDNNGCEYK